MITGIFGFAISANYSLTSPMLVNMVSIDEFSNAYGLLLLIQGVSNLVGPPFAGYLYDISNIWYFTFGFAGIFITLSGIFVVILPLVYWIKSLMAQSKQEDIDFKAQDEDIEKESCSEGNVKDKTKEETYNLVLENGIRKDDDTTLHFVDTEVILDDAINQHKSLDNPKPQEVIPVPV